MNFSYLWLKIVNKIRNIIINNKSNFSTVYTKLVLNYLLIEYGNNIRFFGTPKIVKKPNSTIYIGDNCRFRSDFSSNLVGVNRKCIISTLKSNSLINIGAGGHLYWMYRLSVFGILGFLAYLHIHYLYIKNIVKFIGEDFMFYFLISLGSLILLGFMKNLGGRYTWFIYFTIIPGSYFLSATNNQTN